MHILLISHEFGYSASGVMSKRIALELHRQGCEVTVISSSYYNGNEVEYVYCDNLFNPNSFFYRAIKYLYRMVMNDDLDYHYIWRIKAIKAGRDIIKRKHIEWIYCRSTPLDACVVGNKLGNEFGIPVLQHFADPYPSLYSTKNAFILERLKKKFAVIIRDAALVSFGTKEMLKYQLETYNIANEATILNKCFISHDVIESCSTLILPLASHEKVRFIYLGTFGNYRDPYPLFMTIDKLNSNGYPCQLFVYSKLAKTNYYHSRNIRFCGRTDDIEQAMKDADVFIDLDIKDNQSVFISSKLKDYIRVNRLIISITRIDSPTSNVVKNVKSILISANDTNSLYNTLIKAFDVYKTIDINDRFELLKEFSPKNAVSTILSKMCVKEIK